MPFLDLLTDAVLDCVKLLPFLFLTIFLMEYLEHRTAEKFIHAMGRAGAYGPLVGAGLGLVPQCGFSAAVAHLFNGGLVSAGTLVAVFLSTSDEALPILLANPAGFPSLWKLMLTKFLIAVQAGFLVDLCWRAERQKADYEETEMPHECASDGQIRHILLASVQRTGSILLFLFLVTLGLNVLIYIIGEKAFASLLLPGIFQPVLAAVIGFIPNCAASVLLTQLYLDGMITFGSAVSGLCTAAGIGLLVLLKGKRSARTYGLVLGVIFGTAILAGSLLQLIMP